MIDALSFWKSFRSEHWNGSPVVFSGIGAELGAEVDIFDGMLRRAWDASYANLPPLKLYVGASPDATDLPHPERTSLLPRATDPDLRGYVRRLEAELRGEPLGFIVNHVQALDARIHAHASAFLEGALRVLPFPSGGALCASFLGTYRSTQVGIHKDPEHVFVVPVRGRKRFWFWDDRALATNPAFVALGDDVRKAKVRIPNLSFADVAANARRMDVGPGDLLYIPKGIWHIAEPEEPYNVSFHVGLFSNERPPSVLSRFFGDARTGFRDREPDELRAMAKTSLDLERWMNRHGLGAAPPSPVS